MLSIILTLCVLFHGDSGADSDEESVSVKEGDSVTLHTGVITKPQDRIQWFFKDIRIAKIIRNISSCTDVQCNKGTERFRDRLKLDHQTGSLTITDIRTEDSGLYELQITNSISKTDSLKIFSVTVRGASDVGRDEVSVKEGDSVTLHTGVITKQQDRVQWFFNNIRIARINGDQSQICTDVQCNEGTERFRDRLKLDNQTGALTITNINTTDSGVYHLQINSRNRETIFSIAVHDVPAAEQPEMKMVKEGESVTLYPGEVKNPNDVMTWYHNDVLIAEITGDQSQICADDQCKERFRDRLTLDHQTGSLNIMNTRTTDAGLYKLQINSSRIRSSFSIRRITSFSVAVSGSGLSAGPVAGISAAIVLLVFAAVTAVVIYYRTCQTGRRSGSPQESNVEKSVAYSLASQNGDPADVTSDDQLKTANGTH